MAKQLDTVEFKEFDGLRNTTKPERLKPSELQFGENVDIDDEKLLSRRPGRVLRVAGSTHSLWSDGKICLAVQGTTLYRVNPGAPGAYTLSVMRTELTAGAPMSFWSVAGFVYYSNGFQNGVVQAGANRTWGLQVPGGQPASVAIGGGLAPGRYQYAVTFLRDDGQESGTGGAAVIDLTGQSGIRFSAIPASADPTVSRKAIYLTATNGKVLYRAMIIPNADTTAEYRNEGYDLRLVLNTQFGSPAPAGHMIAYYRGHTLVAEGPVLWRSEPFRYELFMQRKGFNLFEADINLVAPVEDGVFIGADKTYFLGGASPDKWTLTVVAGYPAIPGTLAYQPVEGGNLGDGVAGRVAMWASPRGHCIGTNGGTFKNLTEARYSYPSAQRGAGIVRQVKGMNQFLAALEGTGTANNASS